MLKKQLFREFSCFCVPSVFGMDSEQAIRGAETKKLKATKAKGKAWEEKEDIALIIEVLEREHMLFGEIKGAGVKSIQRKRQDSWQDVTDILNSYELFYRLNIYNLSLDLLTNALT